MLRFLETFILKSILMECNPMECRNTRKVNMSLKQIIRIQCEKILNYINQEFIRIWCKNNPTKEISIANLIYSSCKRFT